MPLIETFHHTDVDGVPVVWAAGPDPLAATLVFRVGRSDETFVGGGITHLVEHLVMRAVGRMPIDVNAHVGAHTTAFVASGTGRHVVDFLTRVCAAVSDLDTAELDVERKVLAAEAASSGGGAAAEAASLRYGCRGAALLAYRDLGIARVPAAQVREWAGRWFSRDNAVLALSGPVPDGLRLPLPAGERMPVAPLTPRPLPLPAWDDGCGGTAVSVPVPIGAGMELAVGRLLSRAAEDVVRHGDGLAYSVDVDLLDVDAGTVEVAVHADNSEEDAPRVARSLLDVVRRLADDGPTEAEMAADLEEALEALSDPRSVPDAVSAAATDLLLGLQPLTPAQRYDLCRRRSPADVREVVRTAAAGTLALLPGEPDVDLPGLGRLPASSRPVPGGRILRPRLFAGAPRGARLVHGELGVALRTPDTDLVAHWDDVVGVSVLSDGTHVLQTADGPAVPVPVGDFRGGADVVAEMRRRLPEDLFVVEEPDEQGEGVA